MDGGREHLFSSKFACPVCSYSLPELEPRLFSFNSPVGACPTLRRPGPGDGVRPRARGRLPVAQPGQRRGEGLGPAQRLHLLACSKAWPGTTASTSTRRSRTCRREARQVLLHGSGDEEIEFVYQAEGAKGGTRAQRQALASVRRHHPELRAPLPRDRFGRRARGPGALPGAPSPAPHCDGTRLRREARHVFLQGDDASRHAARPIYEVEHATLAECLAYFETLQLERRQGRDRRQGGARDPLAAEVPERRRA